ncbi:MAG: hypothetical protein AABW51_04985 [Nanoarchaeota archaeon]
METQYGIITAKRSEYELRDLLVVPHKNKGLVVSHPAFGSNYFSINISEMKKDYSHPQTGKEINFKAPTTSESVSAAAYDFGNLAKPQIFDPRWLQLGYIVRTSEGVFANPPKGAQGNPITDENVLKVFLTSDRKVNGIYLLDNDFGFAPYETFRQGTQDCDSFCEGGLARILEHIENKTAEKLREISSPKFYKKGVNVFNFDKSKEPALRVASLYSDRDFGRNRLDVDGDGWFGDNNGYAFGVCEDA